VNFVYICKDGDNEELRYSVRSIVTNCNVDNIWVVGGKPPWYAGEYIEVKQNLSKYKNAHNNFKTICNSSEIPEEFILMNDDFFITKQTENIMAYFDRTLLNKIERYESILGRNSYINRMKTTHQKLISMHINDPLNYEIHVPMLINKNKFKKIVGINHNLLYRSMYGNIYNVGGKEMEDVKVYDSVNMKSLSYDYLSNKYSFLSTEPGSFLKLKNEKVFDGLKLKTKYEKN
jgi:hypothetical protein